MNIKKLTFFISFFLIIIASTAFAQTSDPTLVTQPSLVTKLAVLAGLAMLPFAVMLLTSFVKIIIVLSLFRNALGVQQTPPNQVLNGLALLLTIYVMFPTGVAMYDASKDVIAKATPAPMFSNQSALQVIEIIDASKLPFKNFLQRNTLTKHIRSFYQIAYKIFPEPYKSELKPNDLIILMPSFITTQLKSAFEIGVLIYLPFFVIDLVTSNILLAMGMMMLSPLTIALPIKLLLLVMIDGWTLLVQGLVLTFK
ncbi:MAG: Flagellar biosynthetic protein FliP [Candidatus Anoxychlamydiales bacterium]|nr:Flagellar biosynthetic protein FliP [Candidatus Anoxychlamydiales bacterium]NGX36595.1 Flagellar biosynthetic protein FliP [Candidatus Anoxychlamydiales bacterium]